VDWLRRNLFSSLTSTLLSVLLLSAALWVAVVLAQWLVVDAYWAGMGPAACPDKGAFCWPFVRERYDQFLYGFYPVEHRWRIDVGLAAAAALILSFAFGPRSYRRFGFPSLALVYVVAAAALFLGGWGGLEYVPTHRWGGAFLTLVTVAFVFALALPAGVLLALGRTSMLPLVRSLCALWIEFWRGVPALVVLFVATIMFPLFVPENINVDRLLRALIAMTILMSSYLAEAVRGALSAVPQDQHEAAQVLGLGYWRRMFLVVMPQALSTALPQIASNLLGLLKETTVLLVIGVPDILGMVQAAASDPAWLSEGALMTGYLFTAVVFWVCCFGLSQYSRRLERQLAPPRQSEQL
jgi:general L-amino acid transport system permease protein